MKVRRPVSAKRNGRCKIQRQKVWVCCPPVLSDSHTRAIYDIFGKKGLEVEGWEVSSSAAPTLCLPFLSLSSRLFTSSLCRWWRGRGRQRKSERSTRGCRERERRGDCSRGPTQRFVVPSRCPTGAPLTLSSVAQGTISVGVDATDLFDRYDEDFEEMPGGALPHIEINRMHISQSIEVPDCSICHLIYTLDKTNNCF